MVSQQIERRKTAPVLSEEQIEEIAEKAAEKEIAKLTNQIYLEVGKGVVKRALYLIGAFVVGVGLWAKAKGWIS